MIDNADVNYDDGDLPTSSLSPSFTPLHFLSPPRPSSLDPLMRIIL